MPSWQELCDRYHMNTVRRVPLTIVRGEGARVWDEEGNEYLDFVAGWAVCCLGHCHPVIADTLAEQARTLIVPSNQYYSIPQVQLMELLVQNSCCDQVFFSNSGAEANEGAVKLARKYGKVHLNGAYQVISALNSFHGRTLAMTAATGNPHYHEAYHPLPTGFINVPFNDIEAIKAATNASTCAVMLEPIQGEAGVIVPDDDYLKEVRAWCDERGILLILDEVQTGVGRLGTLWGYEVFGVEPDIMTLAKGLGGGVPISALLAKEKAAVFEPGNHGSTFGGEPLMTAVGYAVLKYVIDNDIPAHVQRVGEHLRSELGKLKEENPDLLAGVRGKGLLNAVLFTQDISADVLQSCLKESFLVNAPRPNALRLMPPLNITEAEASEAVERLGRALARVREQAKVPAA